VANKQAAPSCTAWRSIAPVSVVELEDNGDILAPLKRVRDKYVAKADELKEKAFGENRAAILEAAATYIEMAELVGRLIYAIDGATYEEPVAPVDKTEKITSEKA